MPYFNFLQDEGEYGPTLDQLAATRTPDPYENLKAKPQAQETPVGKLKKSYADIDSAYGDAIKVLGGLSWRGDVQDIINQAHERAQKRENPIKLADDIRFIAGVRGGAPFTPEEVKALHGAAEKLTKAYKAQGDLEEMRKPGGPLALGPNEIAGRKEYLNKEIQSREEQLKTAGDIRTPGLKDELKKLNEEAGRVNFIEQNQNQEYGPPVPPDLDSVLKASGTDRARFLAKTAGFLSAIGYTTNIGFNPNAFGPALNSMLAASGDAGVALMAGMNKAMQPQQKPPHDEQEAQRPGQGDPYQSEIDQQRNEMRNSLRELKNLKTFDSGWKVALYIMFSVILGPAASAALFTNKARRGELKWELDAMEKDLAGLMRQQEQARRFQETVRHNAVTEGMQGEKMAHDQYMDEEYLKLRRASPRGKDPEYDAALHGYRLQRDALDEVQDVLNNQFNYSDAEVKNAQKLMPEARKRVDQARGYVMKILNRQMEEARQPRQ